MGIPLFLGVKSYEVLGSRLHRLYLKPLVRGCKVAKSPITWLYIYFAELNPFISFTQNLHALCQAFTRFLMALFCFWKGRVALMILCAQGSQWIKLSTLADLGLLPAFDETEATQVGWLCKASKTFLALRHNYTSFVCQVITLWRFLEALVSKACIVL